MSDAPFGDLLPGSLPWSLLGGAWTWILALLLGATAVRLARAVAGPRAGQQPDAAPPEPAELVAWAVLGIPLQALAWLVLSAAGELRPAPVLAVAVGLTLFGACIGARECGRAVSAWWHEHPWRRRPAPDATGLPDPAWLHGAGTWGLLVVVLLAGLLALTPTAYYDDLVYHLGLPRQALMLGSWPALPNFHHAFMPAGWEINFVLPLAVGGGTGPQVENALGLVLLAVVTLRLGRTLGASPAASAAATLVLVGSPVFLSCGALAGSDLFVALGLASGLERLLSSGGRRAGLAGLLAGAAWSAKYVALPGVAGLALAAFTLRSGTWTQRARAAAIVLGLALLVGSPWTVRATWLTGNPLYPAFAGVLGGAHWSAESAALLTRDSAMGALPTRGLAAFPLSFVDLALHSGELGTPSGLNAWFLVLVVGGVWAAWRRRSPLILATALFAATGWLGWCVTSLMLRFALAWLVALVPVAALAVDTVLASARKRLSARAFDFVPAALLVALAGSALASGTSAHAHFYGDGPFPFGGRRDVLTARIHLAAAARDLARDLPRDARLLVVGEARLGLLPRRAVLSAAMDQAAVAPYLDGAADPAAVTRRVREAGFTHLLVNARELERFDERYGLSRRLGAREAALLATWIASLEPTGQWGHVRLFALPPATRP